MKHLNSTFLELGTVCVTASAWRFKPKNIKWIYIMIIRPILIYGGHVWRVKAQGVKVRNKMKHLQRMFCLAISGAISTTFLAVLLLL
jgi:hypothetical protein